MEWSGVAWRRIAEQMAGEGRGENGKGAAPADLRLGPRLTAVEGEMVAEMDLPEEAGVVLFDPLHGVVSDDVLPRSAREQGKNTEKNPTIVSRPSGARARPGTIFILARAYVTTDRWHQAESSSST